MAEQVVFLSDAEEEAQRETQSATFERARAELAPDALLKNGAYRVRGVLGRGGFGITYRAFDVGMGREVAVKECFPEGCIRATDGSVEAISFAAGQVLGSFRAGFREQGRRLQKLDHPAIVTLHDCFDERGTTYLAMELLEGPTLLQNVELGGPLSLEEAIKIVERLGDALECVHQNGFLHLDIKPENVILTREGPVLVDFDLLTARESPDLNTRPLALASQVGTPGYAPIEQYASSAPLCPATDVYALGATLFHLLSGSAPPSAVDRAAGVAFSVEASLRQIESPRGEDARNAIFQALNTSLALLAQNRPQSVGAWRAQWKTAPDAAPDPNSYSVPNNVPHLPVGFYRVVVDTHSPTFPRRCVCCAAPDPAREWILKSPSGRQVLPLCDFCVRHQRAASQGSFVMIWGTVASVVCAIIGVWASVVTNSWVPILLGLVAMMLNFTAMSYGALKSSRAEDLLGPDCCDPADPATYNFNGRVHVWRFRNGSFAESFKSENAGSVL